jgi:hypothetical protein
MRLTPIASLVFALLLGALLWVAAPLAIDRALRPWEAFVVAVEKLGSEFATFRANLERAKAKGIQIRRADHRLCVDAGGGHRQRPLGGMLPKGAGNTGTPSQINVRDLVSWSVGLGIPGTFVPKTPSRGRLV